jgi:hypothetical protein
VIAKITTIFSQVEVQRDWIKPASLSAQSV